MVPSETLTYIHRGDCVGWLRSLAPASVDAIVTDPPYGLGFMGKAWDALPPGREWAEACLRVLKPGGHLLAAGGTRTAHRLAVAIEDAGFEIRDSVGWVYYNGFPKSLDVSAQIDKSRRRDYVLAAVGLGLEIPGNSLHDWTKAEHSPGDAWWSRFKASLPAEDWMRIEREVIGTEIYANVGSYCGGFSGVREITAPATSDAVRWAGWGTALKPAVEPFILARRPLEGTVAANVLAYGTGALNIDGCRLAPGDRAWVGPDDGPETVTQGVTTNGTSYAPAQHTQTYVRPDGGRWPANLYYCPKASRKERERGTEGLPARTGAEAVERASDSAGLANPRAGAGRTAAAVRNHHPTVKPVRLMRWLVRLVTPPGGVVCDPFLGSGTTGIAATLEGAHFIGAEREDAYIAIAEARIAHARAHPDTWVDTAPGGPR